MEMGPAPAMGGGAEKSIRSRQLIILSKPRAHFTDKARERGIQGIVKVTVTFLASGTIGAIRITKSLDPGLDKSVFEAAKRIKFLPAEVDGKPVDTKRTFEYGFSIDPQLSTLR
jgi:TonB family protein